MGDILSTGVSGLLAFQQALDVTSNNIANAATPGYSVENIELTPQPGQSTAGGFGSAPCSSRVSGCWLGRVGDVALERGEERVQIREPDQPS